MKSLIILLVGLLLVIPVLGQNSKVLQWRPSDEDVAQYVYRPEPILFVHGINDNDATWGDMAIPLLKNSFANYGLPVEAKHNFVGTFTNLNARQEAYLHTFNYGDKPKYSTHNSNSFAHIEWNAWEPDMRQTHFTNLWLRAAPTNVIFMCINTEIK